MLDPAKIVVDGAILSLLASLILIGALRFNPRLFLQDYPQDIQDHVRPKTEKEKRQSLVVGVPFILLLALVPLLSTLALRRHGGEDISFLALSAHAFGVVFFFNLVDLILLDWLIFCTFTPKFVVIPGTEGMAAYKDYRYHFRASMIGTLLSVAAGLVIGGMVYLL